MYMNTGDPIMAVTIPIGSSDGATNVRAIKSDKTRTVAPSNADPGKTRRLSAVKPMRRICGITKAMKPIIPETATEAPTPRVARTIVTLFTKLTFTPICPACDSPKDIAFRDLLKNGNAIRGITTKGVTMLIVFQLAPPRLPIFQKVIFLSCSSLADETSSPVNEPANALIAIPASNKVVISAFPLRTAIL